MAIERGGCYLKIKLVVTYVRLYPDSTPTLVRLWLGLDTVWVRYGYALEAI